jgi:P-type E1-E2 ATPase
MPAEGCSRRHARGVSRVDAAGRETLVGTPDLLEAAGVSVPPAPADDGDGRAWIEVAQDARWIGRIAVADPVRPDAATAVAALEALGLRPAIVTGDSARPAAAVARRVGLDADRVFAGQTPEDKAARLEEAGPATAFVGDGINDGVALAAARVGIAVTGASTVATAAASVAIGSGGLGAVVEAHAIARRARRIMVQNLVFAVAYNAAGLSLAVAGMVPPVAAAGAMVASSLSVLANATRARPQERYAPAALSARPISP